MSHQHDWVKRGWLQTLHQHDWVKRGCLQRDGEQSGLYRTISSQQEALRRMRAALDCVIAAREI